jgi:acetyl-CoA C-acetyltransferase
MSSASDVVIVAARRTPIGKLNGALGTVPAHLLGAAAIGAALADAQLAADEVDETILGQVLTGGQGMNPARQAAVAAGIPYEAPAMLVNQVCGSGLRAIALAAQQIALGDARIVVAGGQESMSGAPHVAAVRRGRPFGDLALRDTLSHDGLTDAFHGITMGVTAETVARSYGIDRRAQDAFALESQIRASAADRAGQFATEIVPIEMEPATVSRDEHIRHDADAAAIARLPPAFAADGTVTAANASGMNDGAAALVIVPAALAAERGLEPLARIAGWAHAGVAPEIMGIGPIPATHRLLERTGWGIGDIDLWEINEAFAAQALAVLETLKLDHARVNVNGGAIALGHPIGASGARIVVTLVHEMRRWDMRRGIATLCIGGGMGIALALER